MKTRLLIRSFFTMLMAVLAVGLQGQTNIAKVGEVKNKEGIVTNLGEATRVLKGGLSDQAEVSLIRIDYSPGDNTYYLIGKISNDPVSGKAVQLHQDGNVVYAAIGPGVEISCTGFNCSSCLPDVKGWKPRCVCHDAQPPGDMRCDMLSKVIIGF